MSDLILRGGRVIDPASGRDETADVGFADGRVKAIGSDLPGGGAEIVDARGLLVAPGAWSSQGAGGTLNRREGAVVHRRPE